MKSRIIVSLGLAAAALLPACSEPFSPRSDNPVSSRLEGKSCDSWVDPQGVPHLRSNDELVLIACLGRVHGRDRAWQMDYLRRTAQGRLAEILGYKSIRTDFTLRLLGLRSHAERLFGELSPDARDRIWAYAYGVDRGIGDAIASGVYEFEEMGYLPQPWHPIDSLSLVLLQAFDQTKKSFQHDMTEQELANKFGSRASEMFAQAGLPWDVSILKGGEYAGGAEGARAGAPATRSAAHGSAMPLLPPGQGLAGGEGSNNWVVAPSRSRSGHALFANDPHLALRHPPFWHWSHVELADGSLDVIGASLPGIPLVASGTSRRVAWGLTNSYLDVADVAFVPEEELKDAVSERPVIWVKAWKLKLPFVFKSLRRTRQGWPVFPLDAPEGKALVMRWSGYDVKGGDIDGLHALMKARSADEMDRALSSVTVPSWNFVFADLKGSIGYRAVGLVPRRDAAPVAGIPERSLADLERWQYLGPEQMPHALSPRRGFIATANNRQWPEDSRLHGGRAYSDGFRAFRIEELLAASPKHDVASFQRVQCDVQAVDARFLVPRLLKDLDPKGVFGAREKAAVAAMANWDFETGTGCRACGPYRRWAERIEQAAGLDEASLYRALETGISDPFREVLHRELKLALDDIGMKEGAELPAWGEIHRLRFAHLSMTGLGDGEGVPSPGDRNSVNPGSLVWRDGVYDHDQGASHRLIVEMSDPPMVYAALSGPNPDLRDKPLDKDPWRRWVECRYERKEFPLEWSKVEAGRLAL